MDKTSVATAPQSPVEKARYRTIVADPPGMKRLRLAWRFRVWPWRVLRNVVRYIGLSGPTQADIDRGEELAKEHGW